MAAAFRMGAIANVSSTPTSSSSSSNQVISDENVEDVSDSDAFGEEMDVFAFQADSENEEAQEGEPEGHHIEEEGHPEQGPPTVKVGALTWIKLKGVTEDLQKFQASSMYHSRGVGKQSGTPWRASKFWCGYQSALISVTNTHWKHLEHSNSAPLIDRNFCTSPSPLTP